MVPVYIFAERAADLIKCVRLVNSGIRLTS